MHTYLADLFATHQATLLDYRYLILFVLATVEGTGTMIAAGGLSALGIFHWPYALGLCALAEVIDGYIWYAVGYYFGAKPIEYFVRNSPARQAFMAAIRRHADKAAGLVVLAVKMTYSVSNPTLILVGSLKYDIKKYSVVNLIGSIGWAAMLIGLGHAFGKTAFYYLGMLRRAGFIVFFIVASLVALVILKESGNLALSRITGGLKDDKKV